MMKKILAIFIAVLFVGSVAKSQGFDLGVKGGYLYSDMKTKSFDGLKTEGNSGYFFGVFGRINGQKWFFQPELQYRVRTADVVSESSLVDAVIGKNNELEVKLKTLDMPLQVGYKILDFGVAKISVHAGPTLSLRVADDASLKTAIEEVDVEKYINEYADYKPFIWSGQIGVMVDVARFTAGISYEKGFSDVAAVSLGENDLIMLNLGVKLF